MTLRPHDYALEFSVPAHNEVNNDDFCTLLGFKFMLMVFVCMWLDVCMSVINHQLSLVVIALYDHVVVV